MICLFISFPPLLLGLLLTSHPNAASMSNKVCLSSTYSIDSQDLVNYPPARTFCGCFGTTERRSICDNLYSAYGTACLTSDDCPNGGRGACFDTSTSVGITVSRQVMIIIIMRMWRVGEGRGGEVGVTR
ncbi:hypothetical protein BDZ45DRAFT_52288 [Acephala macrosclerotiorum]|nr:hypothetical protein BDZ45DRAFT_52288 [Acephala macrosclerotiorum]